MSMIVQLNADQYDLHTFGIQAIRVQPVLNTAAFLCQAIYRSAKQSTIREFLSPQVSVSCHQRKYVRAQKHFKDEGED
jgi:hypothetical protein